MEKEFNEQVLKNFKAEKKEKAVASTKLTPNEKKIVEKIFTEAKMPTVLKDGDIVCGEGELDIRNLSAKNRDQMSYRAQMLNLVYLRRMVDGLTDIIRLLMTQLRLNGVENISQALEETIEKLAQEVERKVN